MGKRPNCLTLFFLLDSWCKLDLGFVVDTSKSIKVHNIDKVRIVLKRIVEKFQISENETHVSLETFDRVSILHNKFSDTDYNNESAIKDLFDRKVRQPLRKPTRLDLAIKTANEEMFIEANGDRPEVQSVMVLLTDGRSHPRKTEPFIDDVRDLKVRQTCSRFYGDRITLAFILSRRVFGLQPFWLKNTVKPGYNGHSWEMAPR